MSATLKLNGIKNSELLIYLFSNLNSESLHSYADGTLEQLIHYNSPETAASTCQIILKVGDSEIQLPCDLRRGVLFHIVIQKCELEQAKLINRRPHVVACGIILRNHLSSKLYSSSKIELGLNSNYMSPTLRYGSAGFSLDIISRLPEVADYKLPYAPANNALADYYERRLPRHSIKPLVPVWMIEGLDMHNAQRALSYGVPINFLYRVESSRPFCSAVFIVQRYRQLCQIYARHPEEVLELMENYPGNTAAENQFCEGIIVKLATTEVTTRPYLQDFQRDPATGKFLETDYYLFFNFMIGDCAFDANIIYRIWLSILFCDIKTANLASDLTVIIETVRQMIAKTGVPVVFKGGAGKATRGEGHFFGHMFAALVHPKQFQTLTGQGDFVTRWCEYFDLDKNAIQNPHRSELIIIGEGTTPSTTHYQAVKSSSQDIVLKEITKPTSPSWTFFTHPVHVSDKPRERFHQVVTLMFSWAIPLLYASDVPVLTTFGFPDNPSCRDLQMGETTRGAVQIDDELNAQDYASILELFSEMLYLPSHTLTLTKSDFHHYPTSCFKSQKDAILELGGSLAPQTFSGSIKKLIYIYDLDETNVQLLNDLLVNHKYFITKLAYATVITIY